jgi:multidrug efflux pump subunit AcrA (membrane-fusion protein)
MKKKRVIIALTALIVVGVAVAGLVWVKAKNSSGSRTGTMLAAGGVYVVAARDVATTTTVSGTIHPLRTVTLTAKAAGTITAVTKKEGDKVAAGEVIARIDSTDYESDLAAAESRYRSTMISLETAQTTDLVAARTQLENAVKQAQTQLLSAEISLKNGTDPDADTQTIANLENQVTDAQENLATAQKNLKKLQDDDSSELQLEQADFSVKQAEFNLGMAQTKLATLKAQDVTEAQLTTLQNQVNQAKSSLLSAQVSLKEAAQSSTSSDDRLILLQNQVDQAQASLDQAEDNLKNASTDNKASESDIDAQAMAVESAKMALVNAEANYKTTAVSLAENDSLSAARLAVTKAERALKTAQANLVTGQKTIAGKADTVKLLEANVEQAKASVTTAQTNLAAFPETQRKAELQIQSNEEAKKQALISLNATKELAENYVITAPLAGTITALNVTVGDNASVGTGVATLSDITGWYISAYVDEVDILNVKNGEDASVTMDQYSGKSFAGKVSYVSQSLGTTSNSVSAYPIKVLMTESPSTLVDGMSADVDITVSVAKGVLAVPSAAISTSGGKSYVDVIAMGADKKVTTSRVEVNTGIEGDEYVEITSGLKAGDRILSKASTTATTTTSTSSTQSDGTGILPGITGGAGGPRDGGAGFTPPGGN